MSASPKSDIHNSKNQPKYVLWQAYFLLLLFAWVGYLILGLPTFTSHETDAGIVAAAGYIQLFFGAIFIAVNYVIYRKVRDNQRARKIYGRIIIAGWILISGLTIWSVYIQGDYEENHRPFTEQETIRLIQDCQITRVTSDNVSWKRVYLKSGEDRLVDNIDLQAAEEKMGHIVCAQ